MLNAEYGPKSFGENTNELFSADKREDSDTGIVAAVIFLELNIEPKSIQELTDVIMIKFRKEGREIEHDRITNTIDNLLREQKLVMHKGKLFPK